jgi:hypothetical protein
MTSISAIIWGESDRLARREGGLTVGQVVFPTMNAETRAEVKRAKESANARTRIAPDLAKRFIETLQAVPPVAPVDTYTPTAEQERRAHDFLARGKARSKRNAYGLGE